MSIYSMLRNNWKILLLLFFFSFFVTFVTSAFSKLYGDYTPWPDINIYYNIGKGIYFDKILYKDLFDHKGPIIFFIYYMGYLLSPDSFQGVYIIQSLFLFISLLSVYQISNLFISKKLSILTCIIFASLFVSINEEGGSAEEFILTFILISLYYFIKYYKSTTIKHNPKVMFIHGILFTFTLFLKLNLIVFWFIPILSILYFLLYKKNYKNFINNFLSLLIAIFLTSSIILSYFYINHAITDLWNSYIVVNSKYGGINFYNIYYSCRFLYKNPLIFFFIALSLVSFFSFIPERKHFYSFSLLFTLALQYYLLTITNYVIPYYFIIYLTFVPLGITFFLSKVYPFFKKSNLSKNLFYFTTIVICFLSIVTCKDFYGNSYKDLIRETPQKQPNLYTISEYIEDNGNKPFFCLSLDYGINLFTQTKQVPSVKYFFGPNLKSETLYPELYDEQESYIKNKKVKYVVLDTENFLFRDRFINVLERSGYQDILRDSVFTRYALYSCE